MPIQSFGFSIIHSKTPFESRFFEAIINKTINISETNPIIEISSEPKPISLKVRQKKQIISKRELFLLFIKLIKKN